MFQQIVKIFIIVIIFCFSSCKLFDDNSKTKEILGCVDESAYNYNPDATQDDGSCDYCTGNSTSSFLLISKDGGITWDRKCFNIPASNIIDISIVDSNNIWVCTAATFSGQTDAQILHSNNGGYTWTEQYVDMEGDKFFNYIEFFDELNGIAMGDGKNDIPIFLKTTDGGINWINTTTQNIGGYSGDTWRRLDFLDNNNGYFYSSGYSNNSGNLYKTTNSGVGWTPTNFDGNNVGVLKFYDSDIGLISSFNNDLHSTQDGGNTWTTTNPNWDGNSWAFDIGFHPTNPNKVWLSAGDGNLYYSEDFCTTIKKQELSSEAIKIWNIYIGESTVWTAGYWTNQPLFVNRDFSQTKWDSILLPLDDNKSIEGIIDGVGDNIIVIPGHYN